MKTTVDIPDKVMEEALKHSHASSHAEVLLAALTEYNRRCRNKEAAEAQNKSKHIADSADVSTEENQ